MRGGRRECRLSGWKCAAGRRIVCRARAGPVAGGLPETRVPDAPAITLYTTAICPYCVAAKNFLRSQGRDDWREVRVDLDPDERARMVARSGRTSVPQIFVGEVHVGGYDDLIALHRAGRLQPLLQGEGA